MSDELDINELLRVMTRLGFTVIVFDDDSDEDSEDEEKM